MQKKILILGLPGAGKTTLAMALKKLLNAVHFNADDIRENINKDLGFSEEDRLEQARRMGYLCDRVTLTGNYVIADFICPTKETRQAFGDAFVVFVNRIQQGRFEDTNKMFEKPKHIDVEVTAEGTPEYWAHLIYKKVYPLFNFKKPTALFVGRYQPFHEGHKALIVEGIKRIGQACIAVRDTYKTDDKNIFDFHQVKAFIDHNMKEYAEQYYVTSVPNITNIFYGRDVGYKVEKIDLDQKLEKVSATNFRKKLLNQKF